jgi:hypothetical protein
MKGHGLVQPGWDNPNCGQHTARPDDPFDGRRGPRATAGSPAGREKGGGLQHSSVWRGRRRRRRWIYKGNRLATGLRGDRDGGGNLGQRLHAGVQQQDR